MTLSQQTVEIETEKLHVISDIDPDNDILLA